MVPHSIPNKGMLVLRSGDCILGTTKKPMWTVYSNLYETLLILETQSHYFRKKSKAKPDYPNHLMEA